MSPIDRVQAVLQRRQPDRPPVSFWYHFPVDQVHGRPAVQAHVKHLETYDLDFLKVMNDNGYPHTVPIQSVSDLASLVELRGDEPEFARQLDLVSGLRGELGGRVWMATTIFNAWAVLRHLLRPPTQHLPPEMNAAADVPSGMIKQFYAQDPGAVRTALQTIGRNLAGFARRCIAAGADGIFLSVRDDWIDLPERGTLNRDLVRPTDLEILRSASAASFNILHVCGQAVDFRAFAQYPVHVINWADRSAGPSIADVKDWLTPAICAGVDNLTTLPTGSPQDVQREVADAIRQAAGRPIMIAPGCTYNPARVPPANLDALARAAHTA